MSTNNAATSTLTDLNDRRDALETRTNQVSAALQTLIPLNGRTQAAQESFLLAFAAVKVLAKTLQGSQGKPRRSLFVRRCQYFLHLNV